MIYTYVFSFFSFCEYEYNSLGDFVCIALLLPFVLGLRLFFLFVCLFFSFSNYFLLFFIFNNYFLF